MNTSFQCKDHPGARIAGACIQCKRPVCVTCMELRGYFCTDACKAEYMATKPSADTNSRRHEKELEERRGRRADLLATWLFRRIPVIVLALVVIALGLFFLDKSGKERWCQKPPESAPFLDIVPSGNAVYAVRNDGTCLAFAADTGAEKWKAQLGARDGSGEDSTAGFFSWFDARLSVSDGLIFHQGFDSLNVLSADTGQLLWKRALGWQERLPVATGKGRLLLVDHGRSASDTGADPTPRAFNAAFLFGGDSLQNLRLVCVDARSGNELWHRNFDGREIRTTEMAGDICFCVTCLPPRIDWIPCSRHSVTNVSAMYECDKCARKFMRASSYEVNVMKSGDGTPLWTGQMTSGMLDQVQVVDDRIAILAGSHLYITSLDGERKAHSRLPPDTHKICMVGNYAAAATRSGRVVVFSTRDGNQVWEQPVGGQAWDLDIAADSLYVTAGIPSAGKDKTPDGTPKSPAPRTPQEQLMAEMKGQYGSYGDANDLRSRPECRALINFRLATGKERWRCQPVVGDLKVLPDGNCLLLAQGAATAALFVSGNGSYVTELLQRNGREVWSYKVQEATHELKAGNDSVYLLTGEGRNIFGKWSDDNAVNGTIHAIRRRTFVNRVRKL